ncbi:MAG: serine/threonine-protein kinase [Myxococcales bacterium]|nr:serine/threonine protein kinase [Polyangiaceae bacterium]MDW8248318.1 serine/threonine-protein kinase [Myxococcales bacterium]
MAESLPDLAALPVQPGSLVGGKYRVVRGLGQGAMGVVVLATTAIGFPVAIKLLLPEALEQQEILARFEREVRLVSQLSGRHVARVLDAGFHDRNTPFMVIEYLEGHDLSRELAEQGPLPLDTAVGWLLQALEAITEAHAQGIVHRDLKPSNLFLARQPDGSRLLKVLDFGISKQHGDGTQEVNLTKTHSLIGSPLYMAPEQVLAAKDVDPRSDLWSLGVVLFELLVGRTPFDGTNVGQVLSNVLSAPIPPIRELRPELPRTLEPVLRACLARPLAERYPNGIALARDLAAFAPPESADVLARIESFAPRFSRTSWSALHDEGPDSIGQRPTLPAGEPIVPPLASQPSPQEDLPQIPKHSYRGPVVALLLVLLMGGAAIVAKFFSLS